MRYKLKKKDFFSDARMGIDMMKKGRMALLPHNIKDRKGLRKAFGRLGLKVVRLVVEYKPPR